MQHGIPPDLYVTLEALVIEIQMLERRVSDVASLADEIRSHLPTLKPAKRPRRRGPPYPHDELPFTYIEQPGSSL